MLGREGRQGGGGAAGIRWALGDQELLSVRRLPLGPEEQGEVVGPASGQSPRAGAHFHVGPGWTEVLFS